MAEDRLTIGELARATGTKAETIRYYERIGLLPLPPRTGAGSYRTYTPAHARRLAFARRARALGFTIEQVRALLGLAGRRESDCGEVDAIAREHLAEVERKLADLAALRDELRGLIGACGRGGTTIAECRIVEALLPPPFGDRSEGSAGTARTAAAPARPSARSSRESPAADAGPSSGIRSIKSPGRHVRRGAAP
ncbi:hypothetical protein GCM10010964_44460 [Caldovatus sediminis]|uniref:HTH merR-type domain-containing protein n=1 Tax=Caldovatus sediminis TaxID=2041189 RepID=A0A8J3ED51_9PROT|nr:hypothetical protein GCM10010964_44460 [Caldovatus sediminis]